MSGTPPAMRTPASPRPHRATQGRQDPGGRGRECGPRADLRSRCHAVSDPNGQGISWFGVPGASWFQVERRLPTESWQDVSGRLGGNAMSWADHTLPVGGTAEYRVTAGNADGTSPPSAIMTATRPAAVETGTVDALSVDADGAGRTVDQVLTSFDENWAYTPPSNASLRRVVGHPARSPRPRGVRGGPRGGSPCVDSPVSFRLPVRRDPAR